MGKNKALVEKLEQLMTEGLEILKEHNITWNESPELNLLLADISDESY